MQPASHARMQARMCSPLLTPAGRCPLLATTRSRPARPSAAPVKGDKGGHAPRTRRLKVGARESGGRAVPLCARRGGGMQPASQPHMQARMCSPLTPAGRCPLPPHAAAPHGRAPPLSRATRAGMHHARGACKVGARESGGRAVPSCARRGGGMQPASHARMQARMCSPLLTPGGRCPLLATTRSRPARPSLDRGGHAPRTRRLKVGAWE